MKALGLIGVSILAGLGLVWLCEILDGPGHARPALIGFAICLPMAVLTLLLAERLARISGQAAIVAIVLGSGVRLMAVLGAVGILVEEIVAQGMARERFLNWTTTAYLVTLAAESGLLIVTLRQQERERPLGDSP